MPGGGKGPSSSGNITQTTVNPTQQAQLPFLQQGWQAAQGLFQNNPLQYTPNQTLADFNPLTAQGFNQIAGSVPGTDAIIRAPANAAFQNAVGGGYGVGNSPSFSGLSGISGGSLGLHNSPSFSGLSDVTQGSQGVGASPVFSDLSGVANGWFGLGDSPATHGLTAAANGGFGIGNSPAAGYLGGIAGGESAPQSSLLDAQGNLTRLGAAASQGGGDFANRFQGMVDAGAGSGSNAADLGAYGASAASNPYSGALASMASGPINGLPRAYGFLGDAGNAAGQPNTATNMLAREAGGDFLNRNPFIDAEYGAAARPVTNAYMRSTAPQTDAAFESTGRYGGGSLLNARSQNEENLGKTLGDLGANIYGGDYANERGLMTSSQGTLGSLINQGIGLKTAAGSALGNLGLGEFNARLDALKAAGGQYLGGLNTAIGAGTAAGNLKNTDFANRLAGENDASNSYFQGLGLGGNLNLGAGNLSIGDLGARNTAASTLQSGYQTGNAQTLAGLSSLQSGYQHGTDSALSALNTLQSGYQAGNSNALSALNSLQSGYQSDNATRLAALSGLQSGFDTGNRNSLTGLGLEPSVMQGNYTGGQMMANAGQALTAQQQQILDDLNKRFYGQQIAPYQTLSAFLGNVGQPTTGSQSITTPILGPSPASSALGTLGGLNSAFGSNGALSGLFGGGSSSAAGLSAIGADPGLASLLTGDASLDGILTSAIPGTAAASGGKGLGTALAGLF